MKAKIILALQAGLVVTFAPSAISQESEILAGRNSTGLLKIDIEFPLPLVLPAAIYAGIPGYATGELGFHSTQFDDPSNDFFQLSPSADFRLILMAHDPGMEIWTGTQYLAAGDSFYIGPPPFDTHPIWNLTNGVPGVVYSLTLKLHDLNGIYADSDPFELSFTPPVPIVAIQITSLDATHVQLTWPTNAAGWSLESAAGLPASSWKTVTNLPDISNTNFSLTLDTSPNQMFFRLHLP